MGGLSASFSKTILGTTKGENIVIRLKFNYYGKFVDMGVGKGVKIADVRENKTARYLNGRMTGNRRRPKKWYSKTLYSQTAVLRDILARDFAHKGTLVIKEIINNSTPN